MRNPDWTKEELEIFYDNTYNELLLALRGNILLSEKLKQIESECDFRIEKEKLLSKNIIDTIKKYHALANER